MSRACLRRVAHRRSRPVERLHRPEGRGLPARRRGRGAAVVRPVGDPLRLDRRVLWLRTRPGVLAHEALRPRRRAHPRLLARHLAARRPPAQQCPPTGPAVTGYTIGGQDGPLRADHAAVRDGIADPGVALLDVRTQAEYRGERFWPSGGMEPGGRAGHVPSAVHQPIDGLYDERGSFRAAGDLRGVFSAVDLGGDGELISYCTIGGRACTAWFVLDLPARPRSRPRLRRIVG